MREQTSPLGDNIIIFPRQRRDVVRLSDDSFLAEYERLARAFMKIRNPKTRALVIELLKASGTRVRCSSRGK